MSQCTIAPAREIRANEVQLDLRLIMMMLTPVPTRKEMYQAALLGVLTGAGLVEVLRLLFD
jgi:hypothetical protein